MKWLNQNKHSMFMLSRKAKIHKFYSTSKYDIFIICTFFSVSIEFSRKRILIIYFILIKYYRDMIYNKDLYIYFVCDNVKF